ncbi:Sulfate Permease (SulP) Family [Phytophthora cinnamomi]|uniref:Sulfate Permease (SulP) Family n=1 Tax=Phytophthora cinnamomi TaxID=4785 RepID=UPI00355AAC64|nr:Sulfate Permease (SulP) Family [Phytophthora cinnamomi]
MSSTTHDRSRKASVPFSREFLLSKGPTASDVKTNKSSSKVHPLTKFSNSLMFGIANSIRAIPTMYGYAAIIFGHSAFDHYMPALSKLVIFSSAIHQLMFTLMSSLPFAIGQVQNVGIIFLSVMATSICNALEEDDSVTVEAMIATTIVTIGVATVLLGICLVVMGRFRLAALASYLPMPVIGGYLAYTGIFSLFAAFALSTGTVINDFSSMVDALSNEHNILLCLPAFWGGVVLLAISRNIKNPFALSIAIVVMPTIFFAVLAAGSISLKEARKQGWIDPLEKSASITDIVSLYDSSLVHWDQIPRQTLTWLGMVLIVAFSSSLDVVAIEIDISKKLNINHELNTVGWSNIVSGLFGGYTGSYNLEQTIFTCRSKTNSRVVGVCVMLAEIAVVVIPTSIMSYVPRFFMASTLVFVALDLMLEWLVLSYRKMYLRECAVVWLSFVAINFFALELGIVIAVGVAALNFMVSYVQVPVMNRRPYSPGAAPNFAESVMSLRPRFSAAVPNFGESVGVRPRPSVTARNLAQSTVFSMNHGSVAHFEFCGYLFFGSAVQVLDGVQKSVFVHKQKQPGDSEDERGTQRESSFLPIRRTSSGIIECLDGTPAPDESVEPTEFVVMDFTRVSGMDATAARSAFLILQNYCRMQGINVVFASASPDIRGLLVKNNVVGENSFFATADSALEFCAKQLSSDASEAAQTQPRGYSNEPISLLLHRYLGEPDNSQLLRGVDHFFRKMEVPAGHEFYQVAQFSDNFYFLARGSVTLFANQDGSIAPNQPLSLLKTVQPGAMFGEVLFLSQQSRQTAAVAAESCTVFKMNREQFDAMKVEAPALSVDFLDVVVQSILK